MMREFSLVIEKGVFKVSYESILSGARRTRPLDSGAHNLRRAESKEAVMPERPFRALRLRSAE